MLNLEDDRKRTKNMAIVWELMKECKTDQRINFIVPIFKRVFDELQKSVEEERKKS